MAVPKYVEAELQWREEQLERYKKFREWLLKTHPEVFKEYENYILGKIITGKILGEETDDGKSKEV